MSTAIMVATMKIEQYSKSTPGTSTNKRFNDENGTHTEEHIGSGGGDIRRILKRLKRMERALFASSDAQAATSSGATWGSAKPPTHLRP